jgi:hypothetical protein
LFCSYLSMYTSLRIISISNWSLKRVWSAA